MKIPVNKGYGLTVSVSFDCYLERIIKGHWTLSSEKFCMSVKGLASYQILQNKNFRITATLLFYSPIPHTSSLPLPCLQSSLTLNTPPPRTSGYDINSLATCFTTKIRYLGGGSNLIGSGVLKRGKIME